MNKTQTQREDWRREGFHFLCCRSKRENLNTIITKLNECSDKNGGCDNCPDKEACVNLFDIRCATIDITCPHCEEVVPLSKLCPNCGEFIPFAKYLPVSSKSKGDNNVGQDLP